MWNINAPQRRTPCAIFTKFTQFVPHFRTHYVLKFRWICSRGYGVMGVLSWWCRVAAKFSTARRGETMHRIPKSFRGARTRSRSSITMPSLVGLGFHPPPWQPQTLCFLFCLSVCSFVTLASAKERRSLGGASVTLPFISFNNRSTQLYVISYSCCLVK